MERRLAAIVATDVAGYSRLMEEDEEWTHATLKKRRKALFEPMIRQFRGHIVKLTGDGALIEFPSILAAVQCAIQIQLLNKQENETSPTGKQVHIRIGVSIGDVIFDEGDIYGTGVNVAARLQAIAPSDGICISGPAREQIRGRNDITFRFRGEEQLRNLPAPISVFEVDLELATKVDLPKALPPALSIPERPSLAILPFENLGGASDNQYFSDGITRDLITELSRFRSLFVISANSSFRFRGLAKDQTRIGRELGVRYLADGSVQRIGHQVRVTAELVDADTGVRVWGDRYMHDGEDPGALQDWLAHNIASRLHNRLEQVELDHGKRKPPLALKAYDLWLQGVNHHESNTPESYAEAHELYLRAIDADSTFARVYASLAELIFMESVISNWGEEKEDQYAEVAQYAHKALLLDPQDANGHAVMGWVHMVRHEFARAVRHWEMANSLNPNDADIMMWRGTAMTFLGEIDKGIEAAELAMRLNPLHPDWYQSDYAVSLFFGRRFNEMQAIYEIIPELFPHTPAWRAAAYAHAGKMQEARDKANSFCRNIEAIWKGGPDATPADYGRWFVKIIPLRRQEEKELMQSGLRLAGLLD